MKTYKIASAAVVALLVGVGSAAAYTQGDIEDTPSSVFRDQQGWVSQGGANLSISGTVAPRIFKPVRGFSTPIPLPVDPDYDHRNPSREFN